MKIHSIEAIPVAASFRSTFRFGTTDRSTSPNVIVRIETDDGVVGYGEACPVPAFTAETQQSIVELVEQRVSPVLLGQNPEHRLPLLVALGKVLKGAPFTTAAVDTALLDVLGRALGVPVHALLGGAFRDSIQVHGSVGWNRDSAAMVDVATEQAQQYQWLKLYAGRGALDEDLDRLAAVRQAVGPTTDLFVDINTLWTASDLIRAMPRVRDIGLRMLEQPLAPSAAAFQQTLVEGLHIDIAADEAVRSVADAATVARERSATVINIGLSKVGGPTAALHAARVAEANGLGVMVGSVIEMEIATAMGLHLAAAIPELAYPSYLMGPLKYQQQLTEERVEVRGGHVAVPQKPGLGVTVDEQELRRLDVRRQ